ncbi:hypothetical protein EB796_005060 [Bugula neritina]|uniref:Uncharacterized protein n=1 Tax=Bugula neritina TaxID=10212 RepID=A0A7J7KEI1_BUGNE|nr:hypothetical protein EB796_005060 [Bugula neritina]
MCYSVYCPIFSLMCYSVYCPIFSLMCYSVYCLFLSYKEAIEEIQYIANPVVAAKRLQDLAQGYGCKENVSVLVIQFNCNFLSSAQSVGNLSTTSEGVVFHTLQSLKDKDTGLRLRKRPIPAPRASTGRATDSMYSLADNLTDEWAGSESSHSHSSSIDNTAQYIEVSHT